MKTYTILAVLLAVVRAAPVELEADSASILEKRDTEIVYLTNCMKADNQPAKIYSDILYFSTSVQGNNGQHAASNNVCQTSYGSWSAWEGATIPCTFPSGMTFTSRIDAGASGRPYFSYAGTGNNGKNWNCYRDNRRAVWGTQGNGCFSYYYCLQAEGKDQQ